ncbi:MAG: hypothetical protein QM504_17735 [Pseudomonadota bacterium]
MPFIISFLLLLSFSTSSISTEIKSLYEQEQIAQIKMIKVFSDHSYQQICQHQNKKITQLHTEFTILRGDISRIYFYCESNYDIKLTRRQRRGSEIWDIKDPVSIIECKKEKKRKKENKETNPYVINRC